MLQTIEDISLTKKRVKIKIPSEVIEKEIQDSLEELRQRSKIPGFRPGKAPLNLIEKRYGKKVEEEVLERVIPEFYTRAIEEAQLTPVTAPQFDERFDFKRNNPINLSFTIEVMPKIENLIYSETKIKDIPTNINEEEIEEFLKRLQDEKAIYEAAEKEIGKDDLVTFDYVDCEVVGEETTPATKDQMRKMGMEALPLDIEEQLMGKKKGEEVEFTNTFNEHFRIEDLAGKTVKVRIAIKEVKRKILPDIDDEFAKDLGFENLQGLRENIRERLHNFKKDQASKIQKAEIVDQIIESHDFEVPETLLKNELIALEAEALAREGNESEEKKTEGKDPYAELQKRALRNVKASIIINAIGQKEGVNVTDDEVTERAQFIAQRLSATPEAVKKFYIRKDGSLEGLRHSIYEDKVLDLLLSRAIIEKGE